MTNQEAIKRVQAMLAYMESLDADEEEQKDIEAYSMAIKALKQEKTGRWIHYKDEHQCSQCRETLIAAEDVWETYPYQYCPNCGAKMESEE